MYCRNNEKREVQMNIDLFGNVIAEVEELDVKVSKPSPFSYNNAIADKHYPQDMSGFNAYLTNLSFSQRKDTIFYANEMNKYHALTDQAQFDFYYHSLPKKKYFAKWAKATEDKHLDDVKSYYNVSKKVALEYLKTLTKEQIKTIVDFNKNKEGGKKGK